MRRWANFQCLHTLLENIRWIRLVSGTAHAAFPLSMHLSSLHMLASIFIDWLVVSLIASLPLIAFPNTVPIKTSLLEE